ncbi:CaiB/BaiF CoA transferase family protein [Halomonas sp. LBP4]|uniref:CaiB/BaiF CoA transferase family protein n=1 Tax=Halomonas sp. LBP4 TaxID=2044917 RepID=UPI000D768597|nr:CoA transferase [Halomonas sp. LBP4]PXX98263.1 carnitine dehydratase [Halomonas sp. LBP4]
MNDATHAQGPLAGIRILEVSHMLAGPYCGMLLADLGAEVIKIEAPGQGDIGRQIGPNYIGPHNAYFASLNRNKHSLCLDLTSEAGKGRLAELVASSHALLTNIRPAAIRKLGLTYDALRMHNDKLVCLALTGYGLDGPFADKPAYDYVIQALAGVMAMTGDPDGPPVKTGYSVVDNSAGIMGALGLTAKLVEGRGGQVDVSLYDTMLSQLNYLASAYLNAGQKVERYPGGGHPYIVPAQIFATRDGHLALFITHDGFWADFCREIGHPEWIDDPRRSTMEARAANRERVVDDIQAVLATGTTDSWVDRLSPLGVVVAGVQSLETALESALTQSREMVVSVPTSHGEIRMVGNPIKLPDQPPHYGPPPLLDEDSEPLQGRRWDIRSHHDVNGG